MYVRTGRSTSPAYVIELSHPQKFHITVNKASPSEENCIPLNEGCGIENTTACDAKAVTNRIKNGAITATPNTSEVSPTGTMPKIFKPAPAQMIIKQIGIL